MATLFTTAALAALLSTAAHGHMIMNTPTPYNHHGTPQLVQVSPLGASAPFPCQGLSDTVSATTLTAGSAQLVKFTGGAQHGGGSCQFSVTYDFPPPADKSRWKTIYTLIGGCPVSAAGNLPVAGSDPDGRADAAQCGNDSGVECIRQFEVPIPAGLPSGNATFAWTWFNKIGNREVYMNCAPVSITGGAADPGFLKELPDLFLANVPGECTTGNGVLNIPNPGRFGRVLEQPSPGSEGSCPKVEGVPAFEGGSGSPSATGKPVPAPTSTSTSTASVVASSTAPALTSGVVAAPTSLTVVPIPSPTSRVVVPIPTPSVGAGNGSGSAGSQPCAPDGALICFSSTTFGLCAHGKAVEGPVAAGTTCANGKIMRRSAKFGFSRRL